jgi:hypothetical protein
LLKRLDKQETEAFNLELLSICPHWINGGFSRQLNNRVE